jgi:hypothetical protein
MASQAPMPTPSRSPATGAAALDFLVAPQKGQQEAGRRRQAYKHDVSPGRHLRPLSRKSTLERSGKAPIECHLTIPSLAHSLR